MHATQIIEISRQADDFMASNPDCGLSKDTVFLALIAPPARRVAATRRMVATTAPEWLAPLLQRLKGKHMTASEILEAAGYFNPTSEQAKGIGSHLRSMGYEPRKSNGRQVFDI